MSDNWFKQLTQRLIWAGRALTVDSNNPVIRLDNGLELDLQNKKITLEGDLHLHITGRFEISSDGEMYIQNKWIPQDNG